MITLTHPFINDPKYWHERAEELRSIAKLLDDTEVERQIRAIGVSYDRLAKHVQLWCEGIKGVNRALLKA
ncbi:hypothetical protein [Bradyrhizobium sp. ORS 111]|uniref:hypothetical protein n=1 Tax=Bradyrhizobium sp. ORS 111 TaxID=1685958 RepID=UPI00388EA846